MGDAGRMWASGAGAGAGARHRIDSPLFLSYAELPVPPLRCFLQEAGGPSGVVERIGPGVTTAFTPWYSENWVELSGTDVSAVIYLVAKDDDSSLLMACLDEAFESLFGLMSGADFGDPVTELVARHWPELYGMLVASNDGTPGARMLCNVVTANKVQWAVADELRGDEREEVTTDRLSSLIGASLETYVRALNYPLELPGLVHVLGGPDQLTRRLSAISSLLGSAASIGSSFADGVQLADVVEMVKEIADSRPHVKELAPDRRNPPWRADGVREEVR